ncbi:hypothetical protein [Robertmurraya siralis]|uniref:hypothetical protein n=1 Tax=Robertmurraya siralis TaxID=77777 RepID=UPI0010F62648|nr:hypothetical protein [Robertmurraya siralis]
MDFALVVHAAEKEQEGLTKKEYDYLLNVVGHTEEEIKELPVEVAKELVSNKAELKSTKTVYENIEQENDESNGEQVSILGTIPSADIQLGGTVYKVTSDRSGYNKYYMYGNYRWLKSPFYTLVDKMTIGFPSSSGFILPTSNGSITQHQHRYSYDFYGNGKWVDTAIKYSPSDWSANAGVAGSYDLRKFSDFTLHKGYVGQYVYVRNTTHGDMNIKLEYGHKSISGAITVSVYPAGLGITPTTTTDTKSYALTLTY